MSEDQLLPETADRAAAEPLAPAVQPAPPERARVPGDLPDVGFSDADLAAAEAAAADGDEPDPRAPLVAPDLGAEPELPPDPVEPPAPPLRPADLLDVRLRLTAELGRARLPVAHVVNLEGGAIVDLDRSPDDPVDVYVNGMRYGTGRLVLVGEEWAIRLDHVDAPAVEQASSRPPAPGPGDDYRG
jgi:flagellar motor switch protein FliN